MKHDSLSMSNWKLKYQNFGFKLHKLLSQWEIFNCGVYPEKLLLSHWAQDDHNKNILKWHKRPSHYRFYDVWFPIVDFEVERCPLQNQGDSNKSIFSMDKQVFLSEYLPEAYPWIFPRPSVKKCVDKKRKCNQHPYGGNACQWRAPYFSYLYSVLWDSSCNSDVKNSWRK